MRRLYALTAAAVLALTLSACGPNRGLPSSFDRNATGYQLFQIQLSDGRVLECVGVGSITGGVLDCNWPEG